MRLTSLCMCGTLLAFLSLSWTTADEGDLFWDQEFGPCSATLRPEEPCRQGQVESMCPYRLSLPPLTLHLPKELRELEKIVKDLQNLKDNVDELRKMCADCTVSQTERECGSRRESEQEKLNEGINRHIDEKNRLNDKNRETQKECGTDRVKVEKTMEGELGYGDTDFDKITSLEEKRRNKWEAERESNKRFLKENKKEEPLKEEAESNGKTKKEGSKEKEKMDQTKLTTAAGEERIVDTVRKKMVAKNNRETDRDRNKDGAKGNSKRNREDMLENGKDRKVTSDVKNIEKAEESDLHVWGNETKEAEKKSQTEVDRGNDGIKMSEDHAGHTNREREQHREERKKDMEKGTKVERNNEKPKQSASIGHAEQEKTIKEGEDGERGTEIKTEGEITVQSVQRDSDGELASSKETERADFVSISPTPLSIISFTPRHDYVESNEAITFTSSPPSPPSSRSTSHLITDVNQGITIVAVRRPTQSLVASGITENSPDVEDGFRTTTRPTTVATINSLGGPGQQIASETLMFTSATSARPRAGFKGPDSSTTTTLPTTTQNVYTTTFTGVADHSRWKAKKNISSNTKTGVKPLPGRGPKPGEKRKPAVSETSLDNINNSETDMSPSPDPVTQISEASHSQRGTDFSPSTTKTMTLVPKTSNSLETGRIPRRDTLSEGFTMSPNSRITSDPTPLTASRPPLIPTTTRANKISRRILPSVIPSTIPGSTNPNQASNTDLQAEIIPNMEEKAAKQTPVPDTIMIPVPSPSTQTTSTINPNLRSTTSSPKPLAAESSTPSARELRVKIKQVAAFLNNSLSPNGRPLDSHPKDHAEDNQGGSRPDSKLPSKVTRDCSDYLAKGATKSGLYLVTPDLRSRSFPVFCDMQLDGGGWTVLQRRQDGSVSFNRTWAEYRLGFGELDKGEFWLGNNMIHMLTRARNMVLRVELEDFGGVREYAQYESFSVASERGRYRLTVGDYSGTAGDALRFSKSYDHHNRAFTTPDRDHDRYPSGNCGAYYSSGWWFDACMAANLNGKYYVGKYKGVRDGIFWGTWQNISSEYYPTNDRQSFKTVRMMIRPLAGTLYQGVLKIK
ncbi:hypothetical protein JOQ06_003184 [Pogonophryne albipinna]|uniref:Fibrinogen C-terminal domain-containing protein n=1 Tax=Pogonophryne albipinna TaxID=1090488 RepID=A0AAD6B5T7_9TELE|nr:hypothetical protein JOQ06_003184 [Pogonophryne albipinna]